MATASAKKKAAIAIRRMSIEPAQGGAVSTVHPQMEPGQSMMSMQEPQPMVHTDLASLHAHVTKHFGHLFGKKAATAAMPKVKDTDADGA